MGLDMYLTAEKYLSRFEPADETKIQQINNLFGIEGIEDDYRAEKVVFSVAYWRKANAIHGWFVRTVQEGVDECQKTYIEREQLQQLVSVCKEVLADHKKAPELLSTTSGFFFGSTEYDKVYFDDLKDMVKQLERALSDPALEHTELYYHSSW
jgi:hypothetical protein